MEYSKEWALEVGKPFVERLMREKGQIGLVIFAHKPDGSFIAFPLNDAWGGSTLMRDIAIAAVRSEMRKQNCVSYLCISEAWMVEVKAAVREDIRETANRIGPPTKHPDRIEVVNLISGDATGTTGAIYLIKRKPNGRFSHLEEKDLPGGPEPLMTDGRLSDLLVDTSKAH